MLSKLVSTILTGSLLFRASNSCSRIVVDSSENDGIDWIDGIFDMDKTTRIDDRFIYKEVNGTRVIYHYSGKSDSKERDTGRWLLGSMDTIGSDSGWAYRFSWSISPDDANINSLHNNDDIPTSWNIYQDEEWIETEGIQFRCESTFGSHDPMRDFLFITTNDTFEDNSLTYQTIHGFYVRISEDTFTKISGPKRVFYHEKGNVSDIFVVNDASKIQSNGLPPQTIPVNKLSRTSLDAPWNLHKNDGKTVEKVNIVVLQVDEPEEEEEEETSTESIYDIMGRYYRELKTESSKDTHLAELNNGMVYPMIGLGTKDITGVNQNHQIIKEAVTQHHYAAIDSASVYESEPAIGMLLKEDKDLRSGLFLCSKVWPTDLFFQATLDSVQKSQTAMKVNYIDLYMIAWPKCDESVPSVDCSRSKDGKWQQSYEALLKLYGEGIILNIGVSGWNEELMTSLLEEFSVKPQVVQNKMDLQTMDWDLKDFYEENEILLQAYSTFVNIIKAENAEYREWKEILETLAKEVEQEQEVKVTPSQLALRFMVENDIAVIPRSSKSQHLKENHDIFNFEFTNDLNVRMGGRDVEKEEL